MILDKKTVVSFLIGVGLTGVGAFFLVPSSEPDSSSRRVVTSKDALQARSAASPTEGISEERLARIVRQAVDERMDARLGEEDPRAAAPEETAPGEEEPLENPSVWMLEGRHLIEEARARREWTNHDRLALTEQLNKMSRAERRRVEFELIRAINAGEVHTEVVPPL